MKTAEFENIVESAVDGLPGWVQNILDEENIVICVREEPPEEAEEKHGSEILGLFTGKPYGSRQGTYPLPARIEIYRQPFLKHIPPQKMKERIRQTVVHEVAHFMGMDEKEVRRRGY